MKRTLLLCVMAAGLGSSQALAVEGWHLNGFVNQTLIYTSDNYMFGNTDDNLSTDYRELALIVNGALAQSLEFSSQLLSRKAGSSDDGSPRIDYGFLTWRFHETYASSHAFRLGRLKTPVGFYNDSRDSPFTRNGVFLPQSIYTDRVRNYIMRADELMYLGEWRVEQWILNWKLAGGKNIPDVEELADSYNLPDQLQPKFSSASIWHFQFLADYDGGRVRMGYSEYDLPSDYSLFSPLRFIEVSSTTDTHWRMLSFEYNELHWSFTSEVNRAVFNYHGLRVDPANPHYQDFPEQGYAQISWNISPKHSFFMRKEILRYNRDDADGKKFAALLPAKLVGTQNIDRYARISLVGWSYRPTPDWLVRLDISRNTGVMHATLRDAPAGFVGRRDWYMSALGVSWRF